MQPRVTAILVVRNGEQWLPDTLAALAAQSRRPDDVVLVDVGSTDQSVALLTAAAPNRVVATSAGSFGDGVERGLRAAAPAQGSDDWLWLLSATTQPHPDALQKLLAAVEVAPSVAIAGPKLVDPEDPAIVYSYGESLSSTGSTVRLMDGELDQAQHDSESDVLGVASFGMLVRRQMWEKLGGFDEGLPTADAGLDLSIRARLAGARVVRVPGARVTLSARIEDFGRRKANPDRVVARARRAAHLHRRLAYAASGAVVLHWVLLVPLALLRSIGHLLGKRPGLIGGEIATAFTAAFDSTVPAARRQLRGLRSNWAALAPLRITGDELREKRAATRELGRADRENEPELVRASFLGGGGAWIIALATLVSVVVFWRLIGSSVIGGGALLPLSNDLGAIWAQLAISARDGAVDLVGPADPFLAVVAVLASLTAWAPSLSFVLLWLLALPLAALGAWWCATRFSERRWPPIVAALLWMLAPPLLTALGDARPTAVLAHLLLPWLVLAGIESVKSWSAAATASLLFAATVACAPVLAPALVVMLVVWAATHPRAIVRVVGIVIPAAALFAPLAVEQLLRGSPLGLLADPGVTTAFTVPPGWQLMLGHPALDTDGWQSFASSAGLPAAGALAPIILSAPLAVLALMALFLPGSRRAVPSLAVAAMGLATAVASAHLIVAADGATGLGPWPGLGLSLFWLGLVGAVTVTLEALGRAALLAGAVVLVTAALAVGPLLAGPVLGTSLVRAGNAEQLPALVAAQADVDPQIGTLVLTAQPDGSLAATIERGGGSTLDETSTLVSTRPSVRSDDAQVAELAGNLASRSGFDPTPTLQKLRIGFVYLPAAEGAAGAVRQRAAEALDASPVFSAIGSTALWRYGDLKAGGASVDVVGSAPPAWAALVPLGQAVIVGIAVLLAIPTQRRRRSVRTTGPLDDDPADTFAEDDNG
ncbi:MAG TPA: glycosyltransferase family 2 protein [Pseudolysinimonas sp.]|nr:glycosyltransferase family 2 protein [Pseudolysinimonas sp.]